MTTNKRLKQIREQLRLNQKEFSEALGVKQSFYSEVENEKRPVSNKIINALITKYNISSDWMMTGNGDIFIGISDKKVNGFDDVNNELFSENLNESYNINESGEIVFEKGSKMDLMMRKLANIALVSNVMDEKAVPTMVRLLKLETLMIKNDIIPSKPVVGEFGLIIEALKELQTNYLKDDYTKIIGKTQLKPVEDALNSLENSFNQSFDQFYKILNKGSKILDVKSFDDLVAYWGNGDHKTEY